MNEVEDFKYYLHIHVVWSKWSIPLTVNALKNKTSPMWKGISKWGIILLGKWLYEFSFTSLEDVGWDRSSPSRNLDPGYLNLFAWSRDFNPNL